MFKNRQFIFIIIVISTVYFYLYFNGELILFNFSDNSVFMAEIVSLEISTVKKMGKQNCPQSVNFSVDLSLLNIIKTGGLELDYIPQNLVDISKNVKTTRNFICLKKDVLPFLKQMFDDATKEGINLAVSSAYRGPEIQKVLYEYSLVKKKKFKRNFDSVAEPGKSEHQLGTTIDFTGESIDYLSASSKFGKSKEGKWLAYNAHKYGFVMSYPKGKEKITGYIYEPWHFRFIGLEIAKEVFENKISLQEYFN